MDTRESVPKTPPNYHFPLPDFKLDDPRHELLSERYKAELDAHKARLAALAAQEQAAETVRAEKEKATAAVLAEQRNVAVENDFMQRQAVYTAYVDVVKGQIDRAQARAEFVQTAAAAIGTLYTGVLAFTTFGKGTPSTTTVTTSTTGAPNTIGIAATAGITGTTNLTSTTSTTVQGASELSAIPTQGIIAPVFLGLAIVLATGYLAYFRDAGKDDAAGKNQETDRAKEPAGITAVEGTTHLELFTPDGDLEGLIDWTNRVVGQRTYLLRMAIISLACGVVTLSLAFIAPLPALAIAAILVGGGALVLLIPNLTEQLPSTDTHLVPPSQRPHGNVVIVHEPTGITTAYVQGRADTQVLHDLKVE